MPEQDPPAALLVTRNFPPLLGGMEKLNHHLLAALAEGWRTGLCGPEGAVAHAPTSTRVVEARLRPLGWFLVVAAWRALALARRLRADVVIAGSGLTAPLAWLAARASGARLVVYVHGLDLIAPSRVYQRLWLPAIRRADRVYANSRNTAELAVGREVERHRIEVLSPGVKPAEVLPAAAAAFRARLGLTGRPLLLSVGRLTRRKGLVEFVGECLPAIRARWPDVVLLVIGEDAASALNAAGGSELARLREAARAAGVESNLVRIDHVDDATLEAAYVAADLHVFPVRALPGDVEGFGMVALEAAAHGLPTVAFDVGGVADAVAEGESGFLVAAGDYVRMAALIAALPLADPAWRAERGRRCVAFSRAFEWERFGARLRASLAALVAAGPSPRAVAAPQEADDGR